MITQKAETIKKCPKCGSENLTMEKMLNGKTTCIDCGYRGIHHEFQKQIEKVGVITHEEAMKNIGIFEKVVVRRNDGGYGYLNENQPFKDSIYTLLHYVKQQEKVTELLGLYQDLFKKLELTVEHDTNDTWAGCVEYDYVEINGGITDEVEIVEKIIKLQKEFGEMK